MSGAQTAPSPQRSRAGSLLGLVRKLIDYGTFLAATLRQRGLGDYPAVHGLQFGTTNVALILARIARGLLRAAALEARINRGAGRLDAPVHTRVSAPRTPAATAEAVLQRSMARRHTAPPDADDESLLAHMPTPDEIAAEVRRRPIGAVIADICRDLGIVPAHPLWRDLAHAIMRERGHYTALVMDILNRPHRLPISQNWPRESPPYLWADWPPSPTVTSTGPP